MILSEDLLQFIWKFSLFSYTKLITERGKRLYVRTAGKHNKHAGPDFEEARIIMDGMEWAGNIEIHIKASDWYRHKHHVNPAYNNVILHVVYENDIPIRLEDGTIPETFELKHFIDQSLLSKYRAMMESSEWVPCASQISSVNAFRTSQWLERLLIERLIAKQQMVDALLKARRGNWDEVTYILLARGFGFKVNALPFENLAASLPYKILMKHREDVKVIEALIFGQAGMLQNQFFKDDYPKELLKVYQYYHKQYYLKPIDGSSWKFLRMRPNNFPSIRLAQFAAMCAKMGNFFSQIIAVESLSALKLLFADLEVNEYWQKHYKFDIPAEKHSVRLGNASIDNVILNTAVTILFSYGKYIGKETYIYRAINFLEQLAPERNNIVRKYKSLGLSAGSAADSQALLQLKQSYCSINKCLDCGIGLQIFKQN